MIEITVVLFIVGLMIAGLLGPLETQLESRDRRQTQDSLNQIVDALYGYAMTHERLPCPDTDGNGTSDPVFDKADVTTATCTKDIGFVPSVELGVAAGDAWGNRFTYGVSNPAYTRPESDGLCNGGTSHFDLCATGSLEIWTRGDDPTKSGTNGKDKFKNATDVAAVVVSHGRNGHGATSIDGIERATPTGLDEIGNQDGDEDFITRVYSRGAADCDDENEAKPFCEYDDIVVWLAPTILNARMVSAGRLP